MPKLKIDLTQVGVVPDGIHEGIITDIQYQVKTGEKWNREGTASLTREEWENYPLETKRLHLTIMTNHGNVWHDLYLMPSAWGFVKEAVKAAGVAFDQSGFEPEDFRGKRVSITVVNDSMGTDVVKIRKA
jgi:hypothetical protein